VTQETDNRKPSSHRRLSRLRARLQATRDDARGIALQTIIIMVVLLVIAGGVAAALLARGQEATTQLEAQSVQVDLGAITSESFCASSGYHWNSTHDACQLAVYAVGSHGTMNALECERNGFRFDSTESSANKCKQLT